MKIDKKTFIIAGIVLAVLIVGTIAYALFLAPKKEEPPEDFVEVETDFGLTRNVPGATYENVNYYGLSDSIVQEVKPSNFVDFVELETVTDNEVRLIAENLGFSEDNKEQGKFIYILGEKSLSYNSKGMLLTYYGPGSQFITKDSFVESDFLETTLGLDSDDWEYGPDLQSPDDLIAFRFQPNKKKVYITDSIDTAGSVSFDTNGKLVSINFRLFKVKSIGKTSGLQFNNVSELLESRTVYKKITDTVLLSEESDLEKLAENVEDLADIEDLTIEKFRKILLFYPENNYAFESLVLTTDSVNGRVNVINIPLVDLSE